MRGSVASWSRLVMNRYRNHSRMLSTQMTVDPPTSLYDERFQTVVTGLDGSSAPVKVHLTVTDGAKLTYGSTTTYQPDGKCLDLDVEPALDGPAAGMVDSMAPFWTMAPLPGSDNRFCSTKVDSGLECSVKVECDGNIVAKTTFRRQAMAPGVRRVLVKEDGVRGTLFLPPDEEGACPGVIKKVHTIPRSLICF